MFKNLLTIVVIFVISAHSYSQSVIGKKWQFGIGGSLVKFDEKDVSFIGDKHLSQIPRFNATRRLNSDFSVDLAIAFGSFDSNVNFITTNNVPYLSIDASARYAYIKNVEKLEPYVFVGGSIVDSSRKMTPTINIGTGATYWFTEKIGASTNIYYKYSLESFESMRSHFQFTLGVVFGLDLGGGRNGKGGTGCYYDLYK